VEVTVNGDVTAELFSETQSRFIVTVAPQNQQAFESIVADAKLVGRVTENGELTIKHEGNAVVQQFVQDLTKAWKGAIPCLLK
ncbi:hypothetical protein KZ287_30840, partial [Escherichia coli]|nr:hypothetical protein [Escherichia coli]